MSIHSTTNEKISTQYGNIRNYGSNAENSNVGYGLVAVAYAIAGAGAMVAEALRQK